MKLEFCLKSALRGRRVYTPVSRYAFVPKSETGEIEHILCYPGNIPGKIEEPQLYRDAKIEKRADDDITLRYPGTLEVVIMMSIEADNAFREANPDIVAQCEFFKIDE
jgi:hypothetical protein